MFLAAFFNFDVPAAPISGIEWISELFENVLCLRGAEDLE